MNAWLRITNMRTLFVAAAALLASMPAALGGECTNSPAASYEAPGFNCTVGGLTFSEFSVSMNRVGNGTNVVGNFYGSIVGERHGLTFTYSVTSSDGGAVRLEISYKVTGAGVNEVFVMVNGQAQS